MLLPVRFAHNAVAPPLLSLVERSIRTLDQRHRIIICPVPDADTAAARHLPLRQEACLSNALTDLIGELFGLISVTVQAEQDELLPAPADEDMTSIEEREDLLREAIEHLVARIMSVRIID